MKTEERREKLLKILESTDKPKIGSKLAERFGVSRQVIVQDIALLRARGEEILATSQGYLIPGNAGMETVSTTIACRHDNRQVNDELMTVVNHGGKIVDVIVEHPIYGDLKGMLMIQSPADVDNFMENYRDNQASLLASLTDGVHLHTIEALNEQVIERIKEVLKSKGYLLDTEE
jgi:transcriptional regulator of NAD metabolism